MTKEKYLLKEVISSFDFVGTLISCEPYGSGHINDTFLLEYKIRHMGVVPIILQKMNTNIFKHGKHSQCNSLFKRKDYRK